MPSYRLARTFSDAIRGVPTRLRETLEQFPELRTVLVAPEACSIDAGTVVAWNDLSSKTYPDWPRHPQGTLSGWRGLRGESYRNFTCYREEYSKICSSEVIEGWQCDISAVHGFSSSKSDLAGFTDTHSWIELNRPGLIEEVSVAQLDANLAHTGIRTLHSPRSNHFEFSTWDGRLFLINADGSHRFAAAKYIAARLGVPVRISGRLRINRLNISAIQSLRRDFEIFAVSDAPECSQAFFAAMEAHRCTWLWHRLPRQYPNAKAILIPRSERRSKGAAKALHDAGVWDLGAQLERLAVESASRDASDFCQTDLHAQALPNLAGAAHL